VLRSLKIFSKFRSKTFTTQSRIENPTSWIGTRKIKMEKTRRNKGVIIIYEKEKAKGFYGRLLALIKKIFYKI
jgi:hypothetical protein